jgi:hypothetical protein
MTGYLNKPAGLSFPQKGKYGNYNKQEQHRKTGSTLVFFSADLLPLKVEIVAHVN